MKINNTSLKNIDFLSPQTPTSKRIYKYLTKKTELNLLKKETVEGIEETKKIHLNNERTNKLKTIKKSNIKTKTKKNLEN